MSEIGIRCPPGGGVTLLLGAILLVSGCGGSAITYESAKAANTPAAFREFLFRYPNHPKAAMIRDLLDEADYEKAAQEHTGAAYRDYLNHHPSGKHARRALYWAERLSYYDAVSGNDAEALKRFISRFPGSRFATEAEATLQRAEFERIKKQESIAAYRAFLKRHQKKPSEWTAAAVQRLERLLLDAAKSRESEVALARFIRQHPKSPYLDEARAEMRRVAFQKTMSSNKQADWAAFIRRYKGTDEAKAVARHMEEFALRTAERSGNVAALERFLEKYPNSPHKDRIQTSISLMVRERNGQAHRWVRVKDSEVEVFRPRGCSGCAPVLKVRGTLVNTDSNFIYDLVLEASLNRNGTRCCLAKHRERGLKPGERRLFSIDLPASVPAGPPPAYEVRIVEGRAYQSEETRQDLGEPRPGSRRVPIDRFPTRGAPPAGK